MQRQEHMVCLRNSDEAKVAAGQGGRRYEKMMSQKQAGSDHARRPLWPLPTSTQSDVAATAGC